MHVHGENVSGDCLVHKNSSIEDSDYVALFLLEHPPGACVTLRTKKKQAGSYLQVLTDGALCWLLNFNELSILIMSTCQKTFASPSRQ